MSSCVSLDCGRPAQFVSSNGEKVCSQVCAERRYGKEKSFQIGDPIDEADFRELKQRVDALEATVYGKPTTENVFKLPESSPAFGKPSSSAPFAFPDFSKRQPAVDEPRVALIWMNSWGKGDDFKDKYIKGAIGAIKSVINKKTQVVEVRKPEQIQKNDAVVIAVNPKSENDPSDKEIREMLMIGWKAKRAPILLFGFYTDDDSFYTYDDGAELNPKRDVPRILDYAFYNSRIFKYFCHEDTGEFMGWANPTDKESDPQRLLFPLGNLV